VKVYKFKEDVTSKRKKRRICAIIGELFLFLSIISISLVANIVEWNRLELMQEAANHEYYPDATLTELPLYQDCSDIIF